MHRNCSKLWVGITLLLALLALVILRSAHRILASGGVRGRLVARFAEGAEEFDGQTGPLRDRIRQKGAVSSAKGGEDLQIAGLAVTVWRPNQPHSGPAPLVIFSHGFHGSSKQSTFLMQALADHGYLVIAPNHKDAVRIGGGGNGFSFKPAVGFEKPEDWSDATYKDRSDDIVSLIAALKKDPSWSQAIDWSKIALAGHSLGGYTVLGLAGAWPGWKLPGVKAVLALSPYCTPYIQKGKLGNIHVPVMYQGGTLDIGITPFVKMKGGAYDHTSAPAYFVEFDKAGHFAWTDLNATYQQSIIDYSLAFLNTYLKGDPSVDLNRKRTDVSDLRSK